jgi:hypothetical protein
MAHHAGQPRAEIPREDPFLKTDSRRTAIVGVAEHGNSAILVTLAPGGKILDRRRIDLTKGLPTHPYHHEGSWAVGRYLNSSWARPMSLDAAVALIERVHSAAEHGARESLAALAATSALPIGGISIRACARLPPTIEGRIANNVANTLADSVMYREALAAAAEARGWSVHWYDREHVFDEARTALRGDDLDAIVHAMGRTVGAPWQAKHKLAAAAALAAGSAAGGTQ